jgi:hypothetical protein
VRNRSHLGRIGFSATNVVLQGIPEISGQFAIPLLTRKPLAADRCRDPTRRTVSKWAVQRRKGPTLARHSPRAVEIRLHPRRSKTLELSIKVPGREELSRSSGGCFPAPICTGNEPLGGLGSLGMRCR